MGLKKYILVGMAFILAVGVSVYLLKLGLYEFTINTKIEGLYEGDIYKIVFPIYIWILFPVLALYIASIAHIIFYGSKNYFHKKALLNDIKTIQVHIESRLLNETSNKKLKTLELKDLAKILDQLEINSTNEEFVSENEQLNTVVEKVRQITNNEYVQSKYIKLDKDNTLSKQNLLNRINKDDNFSLEILKTPSDYDSSIVTKAFNKVLETMPLAKIKEIASTLELSNEMVSMILLKDSLEEEESRFTNNEILALLKDKTLSNKELIEIAGNYKKTMQPEQLIQLFDDISTVDEALTESYLYVLFEYQMLGKIKEVLISSQRDEFTAFKALMDLKDAGKHYTLENFNLSS